MEIKRCTIWSVPSESSNNCTLCKSSIETEIIAWHSCSSCFQCTVECQHWLIPFASSIFHIFIVPLAAPAPIVTSEESKLTDSTGLVKPDRLCNVQWKSLEVDNWLPKKSKNDSTRKPAGYPTGNYQEGTGFPYSPKIDLQILTASDEDPWCSPPKLGTIDIRRMRDKFLWSVSRKQDILKVACYNKRIKVLSQHDVQSYKRMFSTTTNLSQHV